MNLTQTRALVAKIKERYEADYYAPMSHHQHGIKATGPGVVTVKGNVWRKSDARFKIAMYEKYGGVTLEPLGEVQRSLAAHYCDWVTQTYKVIETNS